MVLKELELFYNNLPGKYDLTELSMYTHRDQHTLGAVFFLHLAYHAALCDLTRVALPGFAFPLAGAFHHAPVGFLSQCQRRAQFHAAKISVLIRQGQRLNLQRYRSSLLLLCQTMPTSSSKLHGISGPTLSFCIR
jgi:hypothetical protein